MILTIDTQDARDVRALEIAATAATWVPLPDGSYGVPSSDRRRHYRVTEHFCSCADHQRGNRCKHMRALGYFLALREASGRAPAVDRRLCHEIGGSMRCSGFRGHPGPHCFTVEGDNPAPSRFATMSTEELFGRL